MNIYHNVDQIVSMRTIEPVRSQRFVLVRTIKIPFTNLVLQKGGWYFKKPWEGDVPVVENEEMINKRYFFFQNEYWVKPSLRIWFTDKTSVDMYFDTVEQCEIKRVAIINMSNSEFLET